MIWKLALICLILSSVVLISGCTSQRMEIGNIDKAEDIKRAMPPPEPEPTAGPIQTDSGNQTITSEEMEKLITGTIGWLVPLMVVVMVAQAFLGSRRRRRRW